MVFFSKCLERHQLCVLYKQRKRQGGGRKNKPKYIWTRKQMWQLEHDEKLIWNPVIKQKLCPLKYRCIRDRVNQSTDPAPKSLSLGTLLPKEKLKNYTLCELQIVLFSPLRSVISGFLTWKCFTLLH